MTTMLASASRSTRYEYDSSRVSKCLLTVGILPQKSDTGIHTQMEVHDRHTLVRFFSEMPKVETALVSTHGNTNRNTSGL